MTFGERLRNIRKRFKITQKSIADYLGITVRTYQRYEEGKIEPPLSTLTDIAHYFNLPIDCLLGNGFFSNWEDIIPYKKEILNSLNDLLRKTVPELSTKLDLTSLTESELARFLPGITEKIVFKDHSITMILLGSREVSVGEDETDPQAHPSF